MKMDKIAKKIHRDRDEIINFCSNHGRIIIFGAGWIGRTMFQYLSEEHIEVFAFCVSDNCKTEHIFCDKKVYELGEFAFKDDDGIILAVKSSLQDEIISNLQKSQVPLEDIYIQQIYCRNASPQIIEACLLERNNIKELYFGQYVTLDKLGREFGTDKSSKVHNYLKKYEFFLNKWKDANINILELGVFEGSSLNMWGTYFVNATIYGIDIMEKCIRYEGGNCKVLIRDLADENELDALEDIQPTIIIDDASHFWSHQIKALYHLMPKLQDGGIYILEDLGTSFSSYRNMNYDDASVSAYDFCSAIAEAVTSGEMLRVAHLQTELFPLKQEIEFLAQQISMISFIHESCIIVKK